MIGNGAFDYCSGIVGNIHIPIKVSAIGSFSFRGCKSLTGVKIPNSIISIGNSAFEQCIGLTNLTIPNSVKIIGSSALMDCTSLINLTLPESLISIGQAAFWGCSNLNTISIVATQPVNLNLIIGVFTDVNKVTCKLKVPLGSKSAYTQAYQWKDFKNILEMESEDESEDHDH